VGHSSSGLVISRAAEARPERIRTLVFLSAFVMRDGEAWRPGQDPGTKVTPVLLVDFRPGTKIPSRTRIDVSKPDAVKLAFYNDCDEREARAAIARLVPEPPRPLGEPLRLSAQHFGGVDKAYVFCSKDNAVSPRRQQEFAAKWPLRRTFTLDSGHSPFLSMPGRLAQVLGAELYA
jgi:pimeloyl-ACP methyl ester carboxylesterase